MSLEALREAGRLLEEDRVHVYPMQDSDHVLALIDTPDGMQRVTRRGDTWRCTCGCPPCVHALATAAALTSP
jgi:hypothetical protein